LHENVKGDTTVDC